jgi:hypothetical protein
MCRLAILVAVSLATLSASVFCPASPTDWDAWFLLSDPGRTMCVGAAPGSQDGYDGQTPLDTSGVHGVMLLHYRQTGDLWTGPPGFYKWDFDSPIPSGVSKTWSDIHLWSQDWTPYLGDRVGLGLYMRKAIAGP